jgi:hypothetical protein
MIPPVSQPETAAVAFGDLAAGQLAPAFRGAERLGHPADVVPHVVQGTRVQGYQARPRPDPVELGMLGTTPAGASW